jgi:hypothetical protein
MRATRQARSALVRGFALLLGFAEVAVLACALIAPASAQVIDERFPFLQDRARRNRDLQQPFGSPFGSPDQPAQPRQVYEPTRPPPPVARPGVTPTVHVEVFGDQLGEWLASGLEEAFAETPEIGILRKGRPATGLIRVETRNESYDWPQQAKEMLAADKPDYVVMMIGVLDRRGIRELKTAPRNPAQKTATPPQAAQKQATPPAPGTPPAATPEAEAQQQDLVQAEPPAEVATAGSVVHEFRTERWGELYSKRIDETIAALKSRGVPVFWVGLPSIRGARAQSDMVYLNDLYRARAEKAGIVYVDVWDGFVDEAGNFNQFGPDFEGQTRRLRTFDGVNFTKFGARKLAHYVEREIRRVMQTRATPMTAIPKEEPEPEVKGPAAPAKPIASPVMSLTAPPQGNQPLLGGAPVASPSADSVVTKVLVRGEPVEAPAGRADDFAWPRRDVVTATGVLPPDPVLPPTPPVVTAVTPGAVPPGTAPRPVAVQRPQPPREQQRTTDSWWRPWGQPEPPRQQQPQAQQRGNRYDNNQPSFFGGWFGR